MVSTLVTFCILQCILLLLSEPTVTVEVARGKNTSQSSLCCGGVSSRAVDGITSGRYTSKSCTHTNSGPDPWWRVDLASSQTVTELVIYNRVECCDARLSDMEIRIGDSLANNGNDNPLCGSGLSLTGKRKGPFYCSPPLSGRYVNIRLVGSNKILTLCEVEVYAINPVEASKCPDYRWHHFRGSCYFYQHSVSGIDWNAAVSKCQEKGSHLADIRDLEEWRFVTDNANRNMGQFRIGITDQGQEREWKFQDGTKATFLRWAPGEPNGGTRENCGAFFTSSDKKGLYNDGPCWYRYSAYVCKRDAISDTCETHWRSFGDSIYKACSVPTNNWIDAQKACQDMGANLVKIETKAENDFLNSVSKSLNFQHTWLGLKRGWDNRFYWIDGISPKYTNWLANEPNHYGGNEYCADLRDGNWNDVPCSWMFNTPRYICEKRNCQNDPLLSLQTTMTSSSNMDSQHAAVAGNLLNSSRIWCPQSNSTIEWLDVDLGVPYFVCGVAAVNDLMVGNNTSVTWYGVSISLTRFVEETDNFTQEFRSNNSIDGVLIQELHGLARYIRFNPTRWVGWPCLKVQVYGGGKVQPLKMAFHLNNKTEEHVSTASFRCFAYGFPFPRYTWTKDGSSMIPNGVLIERNTVLQLTQVNMTSQGWYTCTATSLLGSVNSSAYLTVHAKPKDLRLQSPVKAISGRDAVLSCESFSFPVANVTWVKEGQLSLDERFSIRNALIPGTNKLISNLTIHNVSENDIGSYKCRVWNYRGSVEGNIELRIAEVCRPASFDFETGKSSLRYWKRTGNAFNNQPTCGDNVNIRYPGQTANIQGMYWIGTYENRPTCSSIGGLKSGNGPQGTLISPEFKITGPSVSFLIGGSCVRATDAVELLVGGYPVLAATGKCKSAMARETWNLRPYIGQKARLRLIDFSSGHSISFDDFRGDVKSCEGCTESLGLTNDQIPDFAMTASSMWNANHAPKYGRLYTLGRDGHSGAWCARRNAIGQWLQVDLGTVATVTTIATQGRNDCCDQWVSTYNLGFSINGENFAQYKQTLRGNNDRNTIVEHLLSSPIRGRYIRIYPRTWYGHISMRLELYGCPPKRASPKIRRSFGLINETARSVGSTISLFCEATGFPYVSYTWTTGDTTIRTGQDLLIRDITEGDDGVYTCTSTNTLGRDSFNVRLHVNTAPFIVQGLPTKQAVTRNTVSKLHCQAQSKPKSIVTWFMDDLSIKNSGRITINNRMQSGENNLLSSLSITDTDFQDSGVYKCVFSNTEGANSSSGVVVVQAAPQFTLKPRNTTATEGDDVRLLCAASAVPGPTIRWRLNGKYLHGVNTVDNGTLVVRNVRNSEVSEGMYTCEAWNDVGNTYAVAWLTVHTLPAFKIAVSSRVNKVRTQTAVLHCDVTGDPEPDLEWSKDGASLKQTARIELQRNKQTLVVHQLVKEDSGVYKCVAWNIVGTISGATNMSVFGEPSINTDLTRKEVSTSRGVPANLVCLASNPLPVTYRWTKNGQTLRDSDNLKVHNNILVVKPWQQNDFGVYVCHVSNYAGTTAYDIQLTSLNSTSVSVGALGSSREGVGTKLSIIIPFVIVVIILVAVIIIQAYRHRRPTKYSYAPSGDSIGLVTMGRARDEPLLTNEHEMSTT